MATINEYRQIVKHLLTDYLNLAASSGSNAEQRVETEMVFDTEHDHYQLVNVGWENERRIYGCILHIDIKDGKLWIQHNGTELAVAEALVEFGVSKDQIVLGFQSPSRRKYSEFAIN